MTRPILQWITKGLLALTLLSPGADAPGASRVGEHAVESLFDGRSFAGWNHRDSHWSVEDGAITGTIIEGETLGRNVFLFWDGEVHDFELDLEFKIAGHPSANSGVLFRAIPTPGDGAAGYQADIDLATDWLGRINDEAGRGFLAERGATTTIGPWGKRVTVASDDAGWVRELTPGDGWIRYTIRATGSRVESRLDGRRAAVLIDNESGEQDLAGGLALQLHAGRGLVKVQFRNLRLRHLGRTAPEPTPPVEPAPPHHREGTPPEDRSGQPLNLGFESGSLAGWTTSGDAWDSMPVEGDTVAPRRPGQASEHDGQFWLGSYEVSRSDTPQGTVTSAPFTVTHPFGSFLVGGGRQPETRVEIVVAGSGDVIHTASGAMAENLTPSIVDLRDHQGEQIQIRVVDAASGPWGHVNYDDFRFHTSLSGDLSNASLPVQVRENVILQHLRRNPSSPGSGSPARTLVSNTFLPDGFAADLVASEPDVRQPIAFATDHRGRLWIAEAFSYPQRRPEGKGEDRITILADGDGDGTYETRKQFATGLNLVSGIEVGFGGVWVGAAPQLLFIPDRDGDDLADGPPVVLLDGWGYQDTHETLNSFAWGPDGWLYGNQGVFNESLVGEPRTPEEQRVRLRAAVWRYHPVHHRFEVFAHGGSNQWGLDFDSSGEAFMTHCRSFFGGGPTTHVVHRGHYWNQTNSHHAGFVCPDEAPHAPHLRNFLRASARYGHGEGGAGLPGSRALYGGHSHVGTLVYQGTNFPPNYRGGLFTHNLHGHQINHQRNLPFRSGFETVHAGQDFAFVDAADYVAVDLQSNHDGAVYIIDWADRQHCHSPQMERWERSDGRVLRIRYSSTFEPGTVDLGALSDSELARTVAHENEWHSRTARRLLQERASVRGADPEICPVLEELMAGSDTRVALRALWTLHLTENLSPAHLGDALEHPDPRVRAWGVRLAAEPGPHGPQPAGRFLDLAKTDPSPVVRLALASTLPAGLPHDAWTLATALASRAEDSGDPNIPAMIWFGIAGHATGDPDRAFDLATGSAIPEIRDYVHWFLARSTRGRDLLVTLLGSLDGRELSHELATLKFAVGDQVPPAMPDGWMALAGRLYAHPDPQVRTDSRHLGALFSDERILTELRLILGNSDAPSAERGQALDALARITDQNSLPQFLALLEGGEFTTEVLRVIARIDDPSIPAAAITALGSPDPGVRTSALAVLTARPSNAVPLLEAVSAGRVDRELLTAVHARQLHDLKDAAVDRLAAGLFGSLRESSAEKRATILAISKEFTEAPLWAYETTAGKALFDQLCASCHTPQAAGQSASIGPNLDGSGQNGLDYFLEAIIDPNAVVGTGYQLTLVKLVDGTVLSGVLVSESPEQLTLRTLTGELSVPLSKVEGRERLESSLMPEGLLSSLQPNQRIELLKYLTSMQ